MNREHFNCLTESRGPYIGHFHIIVPKLLAIFAQIMREISLLGKSTWLPCGHVQLPKRMAWDKRKGFPKLSKPTHTERALTIYHFMVTTLFDKRLVMGEIKS